MLAEVVFEQKELGNPPYGCDLGGIDFAAIATACGATGRRCEQPAQIRQSIDLWLRTAGPALLEIRVDPAEPISLPSQLKA